MRCGDFAHGLAVEIKRFEHVRVPLAQLRLEVAVDEADVGSVKVGQKASFTVSAYLYEPVLPAGKKAPGILYIHGGPRPSVNDTDQPEGQYLAKRGHAGPPPAAQ